MKGNGLVMVNTGNGKGKTTAALGQILRVLGHGGRVALVQFIKGAWKTGEVEALKRFGDQVAIHRVGSGFTWQSDREAVEQAGRDGWRLAGELVASGKFTLVVLDELTYIVNYRIITAAAVTAVIDARPPGLHILITGRDAPDELVALADTVTEMREIRHHYHQGIKAAPGVEF